MGGYTKCLYQYVCNYSAPKKAKKNGVLRNGQAVCGAGSVCGDHASSAATSGDIAA